MTLHHTIEMLSSGSAQAVATLGSAKFAIDAWDEAERHLNPDVELA